MNQHAILLARLATGGRKSCGHLETECDVRSVTTRMSELSRKGFPIKRTYGYELNSRGQLRRVTYYELTPAEPDLFSVT